MKPNNSNSDETQEFKFWWNSKKYLVANSTGDNTQKSNYDKTQKTKILTKLKNSYCVNFKLWQNSNCD